MLINSSLRDFAYASAGQAVPDPLTQTYSVVGYSRLANHPTARLTNPWSTFVEAIGHQDAFRLARLQAAAAGLEIGRCEVRRVGA